MHVCMLLLGQYNEHTKLGTGADLQAINQAQELARLGHRVTVIAKKNTWRSKVYEINNHIQVFRIGPNGLYGLWVILILWSLRKKLNVVHIHGQHITGLIAIWVSRLLDIPTVMKITIAGRTSARMSFDKLLPRKWKLFRRLANYMTSQATAILAISEEIANEMLTIGCKALQIHRVPNGVDTTRFKQVDAQQKLDLRLNAGLPSNKKIVLFSGRLVQRKGYDLLLSAWPKIHQQHPNAHLVVVGEGKVTEVEKLKVLNEQFNNSITYVGPVANPEYYLQCSDVFLFPSRREGLPNALIEAMACGCACVASDTGGCTDLISPEENGLLFANGNSDDLANKASCLLANDEMQQQLGKQATLLISDKYQISTVMTRIADIYQSITADNTKQQISKSL